MRMPSGGIEKISVSGLGYVGTVTSVCLAEMGYSVISVDIDADKVELVNNGESPIFEPEVPQLLKRALSQNRLVATTDIRDAVADSDVSFITVGTPTAEGRIDLSAIKSSSEMLGEGLARKDSYHIVAVKSTVVPGTTEGVLLTLI